MLPSSFIVIAIILRFLSNGGYLIATWKGVVKPSVVSWFFWGLTALIAYMVQVYKGSGAESLVILAGGIGALAIALLAMRQRQARDLHFSVSDKWCASLTLIGIILWLSTNNPSLALFMSIFADFASSIPTLIKAYVRPQTEHPLPYFLTALSMVITLLATTQWGIANWLFPAYILAIDGTIGLLIIAGPYIRVRQLQRVLLRVSSTRTPEA